MSFLRTIFGITAPITSVATQGTKGSSKKQDVASEVGNVDAKIAEAVKTHKGIFKEITSTKKIFVKQQSEVERVQKEIGKLEKQSKKQISKRVPMNAQIETRIKLADLKDKKTTLLQSLQNQNKVLSTLNNNLIQSEDALVHLYREIKTTDISSKKLKNLPALQKMTGKVLSSFERVTMLNAPPLAEIKELRKLVGALQGVPIEIQGIQLGKVPLNDKSRVQLAHILGRLAMLSKPPQPVAVRREAIAVMSSINSREVLNNTTNPEADLRVCQGALKQLGTKSEEFTPEQRKVILVRNFIRLEQAASFIKKDPESTDLFVKIKDLQAEMIQAYDKI